MMFIRYYHRSFNLMNMSICRVKPVLRNFKYSTRGVCLTVGLPGRHTSWDNMSWSFYSNFMKFAVNIILVILGLIVAPRWPANGHNYCFPTIILHTDHSMHFLRDVYIVLARLRSDLIFGRVDQISALWWLKNSGSWWFPAIIWNTDQSVHIVLCVTLAWKVLNNDSTHWLS